MVPFGTLFVVHHLSKYPILILTSYFSKKSVNIILIFNSRNRAEYITVLSIITYVAFMVFRSFHFDYDAKLVERLTSAERGKFVAKTQHKIKNQ